MLEQEDQLKKRDDRIEELEALVKANDPNSNMDNVHQIDELNAKDTLISNLKYQLEQATKGKKETNLEIAIL